MDHSPLILSIGLTYSLRTILQMSIVFHVLAVGLLELPEATQWHRPTQFKYAHMGNARKI